MLRATYYFTLVIKHQHNPRADRQAAKLYPCSRHQGEYRHVITIRIYGAEFRQVNTTGICRKCCNLSRILLALHKDNHHVHNSSQPSYSRKMGVAQPFQKLSHRYLWYHAAMIIWVGAAGQHMWILRNEVRVAVTYVHSATFSGLRREALEEVLLPWAAVGTVTIVWDGIAASSMLYSHTVSRSRHLLQISMRRLQHLQTIKWGFAHRLIFQNPHFNFGLPTTIARYLCPPVITRLSSAGAIGSINHGVSTSGKLRSKQLGYIEGGCVMDVMKLAVIVFLCSMTLSIHKVGHKSVAMRTHARRSAHQCMSSRNIWATFVGKIDWLCFRKAALIYSSYSSTSRHTWATTAPHSTCSHNLTGAGLVGLSSTVSNIYTIGEFIMYVHYLYNAEVHNFSSNA